MRKGDLIIVESVRHSGRQSGPGVAVYEVGVVAKAGRAPEWSKPSMGRKTLLATGFDGKPIATPLPKHARTWVVPAAQVDVNRVLAAAQAHHWPGHPDQPMPFESLDEVRAMVRRHYN